MKREAAPRRLHMGCGEKLVASVSRAGLFDVTAIGTSMASSGKPVKDSVQQGKDKR